MVKKKISSKKSIKKKIFKEKNVPEKKVKLSKSNKKSASPSNPLELIYKENENQLITLLTKEFDKIQIT